MERIQQPAVTVHNAGRVYPSSEKPDYPNGQKAFENATQTIPGGGFVAKTRLSGPGKSTRMDLIGCLDEPADGEVSKFANAGSQPGLTVLKAGKEAMTLVGLAMLGLVFWALELVVGEPR